MSPLAAVALLLGGVMEAGGFVMALLDLRDTRKRFAAFRKRPITIEPMPVRLRVRAFAPTVVVDPPPPPEVRLDRLETQVAAVQEEIENQGHTLTARLRQEMADIASATDGARQREDDAFAQLLEGVMIAGMPSRRVAVGLFVLGLTFQVLSNFV